MKQRYLWIILLLTYLITTGCWNTRNRRAAQFKKTMTIVGSDHDYRSNLPPDDTATPTVVGPIDSQIPEQIKHCTWASDGTNGYMFYSAHIGNYTLCQAQVGGVLTDTEVYLQVKTPTSVQVCLIPTYEYSGKVVYVGEPRCLAPSDNMIIYKFNLLKNRTNYTYSSNVTINGVMMMKDLPHVFPHPYEGGAHYAPNAYLFCANRYHNYGDSSYCVAFDSAGQYVYHKF